MAANRFTRGIAFSLSTLSFCVAALCTSTQAGAQPAAVTIGVTLSSTGPGASLGIPEKQAIGMLAPTLGGLPVRYIVLDDATDPTTATKNARRLATEDKVDAIIGSSTTPACLAVAAVAADTRTPQLGLCPFVPSAAQMRYVFSLPQSVAVMADAVLDDMKAHKVKTLGFIGFSDSYGEAWLKDIQARAGARQIQVAPIERYARNDQSVTAQALKMMSANVDAVIIAASGTPGALPMSTLRERGYKGRIYQTHGVANNDFLRVAGKSAEGVILPVGNILVAEQLSPSHPGKAVATDFAKRYEAQYGAGSRNLFAGYAYDAYLVLDRAVAVAAKQAQPGTQAFRDALVSAIEQTRGLAATHGMINVNAQDHSAYGEDGRVLVTVKGGKWTID
ncbi:ABC transporter substrate-binding protein [Pandoraea pnomenusa]|jgi:branched-chain amino acid transport system substrate-binding protein|uniref:ABC transporter substrate-binding protein n=1 Tax=Pandoraea pnomenusa TaxID=93220 RepID=UPI00043761F3|nr:ABC transporter substrate-binding protein [Pandoraea pnomenusa]AHN73608.1 branched-chain amino acid ABC transporter substrate-binding protein [Pandoraea pnomenusa]QDH59998.1 ABC transporter substrate-binding protein [Pandoraea pnomenusa]